MNKPKHLNDAAGEFWSRHSPRLKKSGLLNPETFDAFVLLCMTYGHLMDLNEQGPDNAKNGWIRYLALQKQYQTMARGFNMSTDKVKTAEPQTERDEFGF